MGSEMTASDEEQDHTFLIWEKIGAACMLVALSLLCGYLPLILSRKYDFTRTETTDEQILRKRKKSTKNVVLSFLLNLGGGVLLANCFCHWLPEVREGLQPTVQSFKAEVPLAELIVCGGFLLICFLEETLHHFLHPHNRQNSIKRNQVRGISSDSENDYSSADNRHHNVSYSLDPNQVEEKSRSQMKSAIRTIFIVSALSFHSTIEGLALSLEMESAGVWMNTAATSLHKFVISFSVGVELIANKERLVKYNISIIIFSLAPAIGIGVGLLLREVFTSTLSGLQDLPLQILQGLATGTVIYIVFFEVFPKAKATGGTGFQHVISMTIGFLLFLPSLYFHGMAEHDHDEE